MKVKYERDEEKEKAELDFDAERVIEKGIEEHGKNWKEKFKLRHKSKTEIMEIKHKHDIEKTEQKMKKKTIVEQVFDGINSKKQIELEEKRLLEEELRRIEEEKKRQEQENQLKLRRERRIVGAIIFSISLLMTIIGYSSLSYDPGMENIGAIGFAGCIVGVVLLIIK